MSDFVDISASIVLYKNHLPTLQKTVDSFLKTPLKKKLFLIDNSPTDFLKSHFTSKEIEYIFVGENLGFGKAHNLVLNKINANYHLILNPDVVFNKEVIPSLIQQLKIKTEVSFVTPKVLYPNQQPQFICRKHPSFLDLINRKIKFSKKKMIIHQYQKLNLEKPFYPEFIHGCFMLFKSEDFRSLKGFDERYFLYMEDADLCREIEKTGKKILYEPSVNIEHQYQRGSSKKIELFFYHLSSAFKYFLKWGF